MLNNNHSLTQVFERIAIFIMMNQQQLSNKHLWVIVVMIVWQLDLQLPVQSVLITTTIVSSNPFHVEKYSIPHYVIKFVRDLQQVSGFLRIVWCPPPIKLSTILLKVALNTINPNPNI